MTQPVKTRTKAPAPEESVAQPVVPAGESATALAPPTVPPDRRPAFPSLAAALASAIGEVQAVEKDGHNRHHGYRYATAESIITEAKRVLSAHNLVLVPIGTWVEGWDRTGENRYELRRRFLLLHSSGESLPLEVAWPICPEKGRPLDKATAIADTSSLAYLLRDLLMMPRVDEEPDSRDTRSLPSTSVPVPVGSPPALVAARPSPLPAVLANGDPLAPMRDEQSNTIQALMQTLNQTDETMASRLVQQGLPGDWRKLNQAQAAGIIERMRAAALAAQQEKVRT